MRKRDSIAIMTVPEVNDYRKVQRSASTVNRNNTWNSLDHCQNYDMVYFPIQNIQAQIFIIKFSMIFFVTERVTYAKSCSWNHHVDDVTYESRHTRSSAEHHRYGVIYCSCSWRQPFKKLTCYYHSHDMEYFPLRKVRARVFIAGRAQLASLQTFMKFEIAVYASFDQLTPPSYISCLCFFI